MMKDIVLYDKKILKEMNSKLKPYHIKLSFQVYAYEKELIVSNENTKKIILEYVNKFQSIYAKVFVASSLWGTICEDCTPLLIELYGSIIREYETPQDERYCQYITDTIAKNKNEKYLNLYINLLKGVISPSAGSIIEMVASLCIEKCEDVLLELIEKENIIPDAWKGKLNEDDKYYCSLVSLKCLLKSRSSMVKAFIDKLKKYDEIPWVQFTKSKISESLKSSTNKKYNDLLMKI